MALEAAACWFTLMPTDLSKAKIVRHVAEKQHKLNAQLQAQPSAMDMTGKNQE